MNNEQAREAMAHQKFNLQLIHLVKVKGLPMNEAWDTVFGEGAYAEFTSNLYHELRKKTGVE